MGDTSRGLREIEDGLAAHTLTRSALLRPYYDTLYAGALLRARRLDDAQRALDEARVVAAATSQQAFESEQRRLQAEVLVARDDRVGAETAYLESIAIARGQGARWLELRAARGYAGYLISEARHSDARHALAPVCAWFTEGRDTLDFVYAEALLRTLDEGTAVAAISRS
jgi:predicted ATPase